MKYEWDEAKRQANRIKHGIDFKKIVDFNWSSSIIEKDDRHYYGETRYIAFGYIGERLHVLVFTPRFDSIRIIGLRKANKRERQYYEEKTKPHSPKRLG